MVSHLYATDSYSTAVGVPRLPLARLLGWTRLPFYWHAYRTVVAAQGLARRGQYGSAEFQHSSEQIARIVEGCGGRIEVSGLDHLAGVNGAAVIVGNHMSFLETFLMPAMILPRKPVCFVIKESLLRHPAMGPVMAALEPVALTRTNPREDLRTIMEQGRQRLESGRSICIYPQSTRLPYFDPAKFSSIGAKLAQRTGRALVPVALQTDFLGNGVVIKDLGPVYPDRPARFAFGPPIESGDARQAHDQVVAFIASRLSAWGVACH
jgi:1-acyl-sn-glycerol-3-phosphate acyltransferase